MAGAGATAMAMVGAKIVAVDMDNSHYFYWREKA
jgi:hypothetical protein